MSDGLLDVDAFCWADALHVGIYSGRFIDSI
jgi:hypothetical protein